MTAMGAFHFKVFLMVLSVFGSGQVAYCTKDSGSLYDYLIQAGIASKSLDEQCKKSEKEIESIKCTLANLKQEMADLKRAMTKLPNATSGWNLVRVDMALNQLAKIQLHQKKPTYIQRLPTVLPRNTKAIIISVFTNFWNNKGHVYLTFKAYQKRNERNGSVSVVNQHFNIYANTFYYELMLPWDTSLPNELVFVVISSYITGGLNNYYQVKLVGYITA